jgi:Na+/proline symporter
MAGAVLLAVFAVEATGGIGAMLAGLREAGHADALRFLPGLSAEAPAGVWEHPLLAWSATALATFLVFIVFQWWANKNADGGAVVIQRMAASKDEREAVLGTLWFQVANYALRPWPWVLVALASLLLYPAAEDHELVYAQAMVDLLPAGLLGLMLASLVAAFMSTLTSYINLSAAYLVNDLYRPFLVRGRSERHYVAVGRVASLAALLVGVTIGYYADTIFGLFSLLLTLGAGIGLVYIARWFWWRVNAWSEIAAMMASSVIGALLELSPRWGGPEFPFAAKVVINILGSTIVWVAVTYLTPPTPMEKLTEFYRRARPPGWWGPVREALGETRSPGKDRLRQGLRLWLVGVVFIYAALFGLGKLVLLQWGWGMGFTVLAIASGWVLARSLTRERVERLLG